MVAMAESNGRGVVTGIKVNIVLVSIVSTTEAFPSMAAEKWSMMELLAIHEIVFPLLIRNVLLIQHIGLDTDEICEGQRYLKPRELGSARCN